MYVGSSTRTCLTSHEVLERVPRSLRPLMVMLLAVVSAQHSFPVQEWAVVCSESCNLHDLFCSDGRPRENIPLLFFLLQRASFFFVNIVKQKCTPGSDFCLVGVIISLTRAFMADCRRAYSYAYEYQKQMWLL